MTIGFQADSSAGDAISPLLLLELLGPPQVSRGSEVVHFRTRKTLALLAYLVTTARPQPRERLAALFWPDLDSEHARTMLRTTLRYLRHTLLESGAWPEAGLPPATLLKPGRDPARRENLFWQPEGISVLCDLDIVAHASERLQAVPQIVNGPSNTLTRLPSPSGRSSEEAATDLAESLRQAVKMYRGHFLEDVMFDDTPEFAVWVQTQQAYWQNRIERAFDWLTLHALDRGAYLEAAQLGERWSTLCPVSEGALLRQVQTLAAAGKRSEALSAFEHGRQRLAAQLGLEPLPETVALAERLRLDAPAPASRAEVRRPSDAQATAGHSLNPGSGSSVSNAPPGLLRISHSMQTPLIGRGTEFEMFVRVYQSVHLESPQVTVIEGEAGIGKTRLVSEFLGWAEMQGAEVLRSKTYGAGTSLPYQPIVDVLRPRLAHEHAPEDLLDDVWLAELVRLFPELHERYPDLPLPTLAMPSDESAAQGRLFEAVIQLCLSFVRGSSSTLVLFLDDLQWMQPATLDLLRYGLRRWSEEGLALMVISALRTEELIGAPGVEQWLSELSRSVPVTRVALGPLSATESRLMVVAACGGLDESAEMSQLADWLYEQTAGQPFYALAMLRSLVEQNLLTALPDKSGRLAYYPTQSSLAVLDRGRLLPSSVREVLRDRMRSLRPSAQRLLLAAAVLDQRAPFESLFQVADLSEREGMAALENVLRRRLLIEQSGAGSGRTMTPTCRFTHDLLSEFVYSEASQTQRTIFHRRALKVLEGSGAPVPELAHHALAAGLIEPSFRYSLAAGDASFALYAVREALAHYERAWHVIVDQLPSPEGRGMPPAGVDVVPAGDDWERLCLQLGHAYESSQLLEQAGKVYEEMRRFAQERGSVVTESRALNRLAWVLLQTRDAGAAQATLYEAIELAEASRTPDVVTETHLNAATMLAYIELNESAIQHAQLALEQARAITAPEAAPLVAQCLHTLGWAYSGDGQWQEAAIILREAQERYAELAGSTLPPGPLSIEDLAKQNLWTKVKQTSILSYRTMEAFDLALLGAAETNRGVAQSGATMARLGWQLARDTYNFAAQPDCGAILTGNLVEIGSYEEGLAVARAAVAAARTVPSLALAHALIALADALLALFQFDEAARVLGEAAALTEMHSSGQMHVRIHSRLCLYHALTHAWSPAHAAARKASALREAQSTRHLAYDFYRYYETTALMYGGDSELAQYDVERLRDRVENLPEQRRFQLVLRRMQAVQAQIEKRYDAETGFLAEAYTLAEELALPGEQARIQGALSQSHLRLGNESASTIASERAAALVRALANNITDVETRLTYLQGALQVLTDFPNTSVPKGGR